MNAEDFYARNGEKIRPKLRALAEFVTGEWSRLSAGGPGWRMHRDRKGRAFVHDGEEAVFRGSFHVSLRGSEAAVSVGRVNGVIPTIGGIDLSGRRPGEAAVTGAAPLVSLGDGPGDDGFSYICLAVTIDPATGLFAAAEDAVTVVHLSSLDTRLLAGGGAEDRAGTGIHPLAEIEWVAGNPLRRRQVNFFDQTHRLIPGRDGAPARHHFAPVG